LHSAPLTNFSDTLWHSGHRHRKTTLKIHADLYTVDVSVIKETGGEVYETRRHARGTRKTYAPAPAVMTD